MSNPRPDAFAAKASLVFHDTTYTYYRLAALDERKIGRGVARLPYSIRVVLESMLRNVDGFVVTADDVTGFASYNPKAPAKGEIPFMVGRVVLQDFTGVPCVVDLAAMRHAMKELGGDPSSINPLVPCDLVIDHSVQVDAFGSTTALTINSQKEFERNNERYEFLKWGQQSLNNFRCVPPATGIVHQVNLEYLSPGVLTRKVGNEVEVFPDSCVGTDSHTTMINGMGVVGWGVGGIEAEAVMLGQPYSMLPPEVVGFKLSGKLPEGTTATDLVLTVTQMLRKKGVVDKFVEFFGPGIAALSVPDRATIANMAPEYGATMGFFPVDDKTIAYMKFTGRAEQAELTEAYCKANMLWWDATTPDPEFTDTMELDLSTVQPSLAGPKRPQDRVELKSVKGEFLRSLGAANGNTSFGLPAEKIFGNTGTYYPGGLVTPGVGGTKLTHGTVVIAAITSCTNTSNPDVMIAAGLVARKAHAKGLSRMPWVKTSLAPGSRVVTDYLDKSGLTADLEALGFHTVGYGCTTCIGNSGPLPEEVEAFIREGDLIAASVLSGNRNFEGRVHSMVKANFLASPPLVVAYAIAGSVAIDLTTEPLGLDDDGKPVFLKDIWPTQQEVLETKAACTGPEQFQKQYAQVFTANSMWNDVAVSKSSLYSWNDKSTYIQRPGYFDGMGQKVNEGPMPPISGARVLVSVGDSVTTDHISPAGDIAESSPAGAYLKSLGVPRSMFNSYGSRRGNDRVMTRGTFANVRIKNQLAVDNEGKIKEGWWTRDHSKLGGGTLVPIYDASLNYKREGTPLLVLAGKDYGMGSSRDWAAKGTMLLGVRAVIAESFERIHRSNLVGMGVLPLTYIDGQNAESLGLDGTEVFDVHLPAEFTPRGEVKVVATRADSSKTSFTVRCRLDSAVEIFYYRNGGILHTVLRKLLNEGKKPAPAMAKA
ncbi:MAG: aconitate hydratase AcnA [Phycisphaerales bacterium]|nr:aconitate hydratase AcnA [Phycisphaerales bacterium]